MKLNIVQIGNSKGIRIPATVLTQCQIENEVDMQIENDKIVLVPVHDKPRQEWSEKMQLMAKNQDDSLIISDSIDLELDEIEW